MALSDTVIIGEATGGENGPTGNSAGNQTGDELDTGGYYGGWTYVFRAKDPAIAKKMASSMKEACANSCIGYDLNDPDRSTLYYAAKEVNWDLSAVNKNCETTCVDLVSVCLNSAGVEMPSAWASASVYDDLMPTGLFECYTSGDYTNSSAKLLPGDILCNPGIPHTAMVVDSPNPFLFDVRYIDNTKGAETETAEEGSVLRLFFNNGLESAPITVEDHVNLDKYNPQKKGFIFEGWEKQDDGVFIARYTSKSMGVRINSKIRKID